MSRLMRICKVIHNTVRELLCSFRTPVMSKVILTPKKAVNEGRMLRNGFFAVTAGLCGLLMGPAGCSLPSKTDISVSLPDDNVLIREPAPLALPLEIVVHAENEHHQNAYLLFTKTRCKYINKLKSLDTQIKKNEKISEKELRARNDYPLLEEHIARISIFEEPSKKNDRRNEKIEEINVKIADLEIEVEDLREKRANHPKYTRLYLELIKTRLGAINVLKLTKKRWLLLFDYEVFLGNWYLSELTANQPSGLKKRYPRIIQAQYIARLDTDGRAITDTSSAEWESALYYAIKANARYPEDDNFDATAYEIDATDSTLSLKPEAYEDEPFTGQVVFMAPSRQMGWGVIERGLMIRSTAEPVSAPTPKKPENDSESLVQGRLYHSYEQGQVSRSSFFVVDFAGKTFGGSLFDSNGMKLSSQDYRSEEEKIHTGVYEGNPQTTIDGFNRTKLALSDNGQAKKWTYDAKDKNKVEKESDGSWTLVDGQVHLHLSTDAKSSDKVMISDRMILEMNAENQLAFIAEVRSDGRRTEIFAEPGKRFVYFNPLLNEQGPPTLPAGAILVSQSEVRGEFIYERADDAKMKQLNEQIKAAVDPAERTRLEGELLNLQLAAGTPFTGTVLEFWGERGAQKKREEKVEVGKHHGTVTWWHANGQKQFEAQYLKGTPQGRTAWYRENGSLEYEGFWENDKLLRATTWDANNQKTGDVTAGNGTLVYFHSNGQKRLEETFANGDLTATQWWDETGKEVESASPSFIPPPPKLD